MAMNRFWKGGIAALPDRCSAARQRRPWHHRAAAACLRMLTTVTAFHFGALALGSRSFFGDHFGAAAPGSRSVFGSPDAAAGPGSRSAFAMLPLPQRRQLLALAPCLAPLSGSAAFAEQAQGAAAATATMRLVRAIAENGLEDWQTKDYEAMRDDEPRTKGYEAAIQRRLKGTNGQATVVDIGTGSLALLAIMAAKAGAKKVYAIDKNIPAAKAAREAIAKEGLQDKIEVIEGDSLQVTLPEKVDLMVSELIGSIATQEGVEAIIKDAKKRFLKDGSALGEGGGDCPQIIPSRTQTRIAPVRYRNHRVKYGAAKRGVMSRGKAEPGTVQPLRLKSKTNDLVFLSEPQLLEDFSFCNPDATASQVDRSLKFDISAKLAEDAKDFSGFAMWTRLVIDDENVVEVRGQKQTSHWAYVVVLMADEPQPLPAPSSITLEASVDYSAKPVRYTFATEVPV
eukprot:TRINITY_DN11079_c0_g1_i1.p1 TRINITY_DN11079_c0_g1~~TRINITY_DN11079_c0_g1_i1.p1  ORF type:complete len:454 (-),score=93.84 TRINITY_DN11079_c0_g1_i1:223-1584(-)